MPGKPATKSDVVHFTRREGASSRPASYRRLASSSATVVLPVPGSDLGAAGWPPMVRWYGGCSALAPVCWRRIASTFALRPIYLTVDGGQSEHWYRSVDDMWRVVNDAGVDVSTSTLFGATIVDQRSGELRAMTPLEQRYALWLLGGRKGNTLRNHVRALVYGTVAAGVVATPAAMLGYKAITGFTTMISPEWAQSSSRLDAFVNVFSWFTAYGQVGTMPSLKRRDPQVCPVPSAGTHRYARST
jgi:hypothetical protein